MSVAPFAGQGPGHIGGGPHAVGVLQAGAGDDQRTAGLAQHPRGLFQPLRFRTGTRRRAAVDGMGEGEAESGDLIRGRLDELTGHIIKPGVLRAHDYQRAASVLSQIPHRGILPQGNLMRGGQFQSLVAHRLTQGEGETRRRVGHILTQNQHRIRLLRLLKAGDVEGLVLHQLKGEFGGFKLSI